MGNCAAKPTPLSPGAAPAEKNHKTRANARKDASQKIRRTSKVSNSTYFIDPRINYRPIRRPFGEIPGAGCR